MGLLDTGSDPRSLGGFQSSADEGLLQRIFGTNDPRDPRSAAMMGLASGLLRGSFADGVDRFQRAHVETEDRNARRLLNNLQFGKGAMELSEAQRRMQEDAEARDVLKNFQARRGQVSTAPRNMLGALQAPPSSSADNALPVPQRRLTEPSGAPASLSASNASMGASSLFDQYNELASMYESKGLARQAQAAREYALKFRPKYSTTPQIVRDTKTGKLVNVLLGEGGETTELPYGVRPDIHMQELGGAVEAIDRNNLNGGERFTKTMTPEAVASNQVALGNLRVSQGQLGLARERFGAEQAAPQYMQLDGGLYALPKRPQPGAPLIGQPVMDQGGQVLGPPLKAIPATANTAIMNNLQNLNRAQQALALLKGGVVGTARGDTAATGMKGYMPNGLLNRLDPQGVDTRAAIADLGSLVIHDRSGAAVTAAESPRLMPFIPLATDDRATAEKKLKRFVDVYQQETDAYGQTYAKDQGYRENPALRRPGGNSNEVLPGALPLPADLKPTALKRGQAYLLPNGKHATWDGMQFRAGGQ